MRGRPSSKNMAAKEMPESEHEKASKVYAIYGLSPPAKKRKVETAQSPLAIISSQEVLASQDVPDAKMYEEVLPSQDVPHQAVLSSQEVPDAKENPKSEAKEVSVVSEWVDPTSWQMCRVFSDGSKAFVSLENGPNGFAIAKFIHGEVEQIVNRGAEPFACGQEEASRSSREKNSEG